MTPTLAAAAAGEEEEEALFQEELGAACLHPPLEGLLVVVHMSLEAAEAAKQTGQTTVRESVHPVAPHRSRWACWGQFGW